MNRAQRANASLIGLATGDAFGTACYAGRHPALNYPGDARVLRRPGVWRWTDDTAQAVILTRHLEARGGVDQDALAMELASKYARDPRRGYGSGARKMLEQMGRGMAWSKAARDVFEGQGSLGNGAAMRVAPLGAFYAEDLEEVVKNAALSAAVSHAHPEGRDGAIAIALTAAVVWRERDSQELASPIRDALVRWCPAGAVRDAAVSALGIALDATLEDTLSTLETRLGATALETVPFCVWSVARHSGRFGEAMWRTCAGGGDHDTTCAMVGGCLGVTDAPPQAWVGQLEPEWDRAGD